MLIVQEEAGCLIALLQREQDSKAISRSGKNLRVSPSIAPSKGAKLCTYQHWFGRPSNLRFSPSMSFEWPSTSSGLWCSSDLVFMLCPLSRVVLPGQPSCATFAGAQFAIHKLWALSSNVCWTALISVTPGPNFLACSKMLQGACVCPCGTMTRSLSAVVSLPCCRRLSLVNKACP